MKRQKGLRIRPGFYFFFYYFYTVSLIGSPTFRHVTCSQCCYLGQAFIFFRERGQWGDILWDANKKICVHSAHTNSRTKPGWRGGGGNPDSKRRDPRPAQVPPVSRKLRPDWARRRGVLGTSRFDVRRVGRGLAQSQPPPTPARSGRPEPQESSESPNAPRAADTLCRRQRLLPHGGYSPFSRRSSSSTAAQPGSSGSGAIASDPSPPPASNPSAISNFGGRPPGPVMWWRSRF